MKAEDIKAIRPAKGNLVEVIYGDSVTGDTPITMADGSEIPIETLWEEASKSNQHVSAIINRPDREYMILPSDMKVLGADLRPHDILYIMRHLTLKELYMVFFSSGRCIKMTGDHSLMACPRNQYLQNVDLRSQLSKMKPSEAAPGDIVMLSDGRAGCIISIRSLGECKEYVYDISVRDDEIHHVFFASGVLVHNTDSCFLGYDGLTKTIEGWDQMSFKRRLDIIIGLHKEYINGDNDRYMKEYYGARHANSIHELELETIAKSGIWLNVKKRYAEILAWKDGKYYDEDELPMKIKGLEVVKSSYPAIARDMLKSLVRSLLEAESTDEMEVLTSLNTQMQQARMKWEEAPLESICPSISVNNYTKYIISDDKPEGPEVALKCPFAVRGLATYNNIRQVHGLPGEPIYGGKLRYYVIKPDSIKKRKTEQVFCFRASEYPDWAPRYAPIDRKAMFIKCVLDPFNRILEGIGFRRLQWDGFLGMTQLSLF